MPPAPNLCMQLHTVLAALSRHASRRKAVRVGRPGRGGPAWLAGQFRSHSCFGMQTRSSPSCTLCAAPPRAADAKPRRGGRRLRVVRGRVIAHAAARGKDRQMHAQARPARLRASLGVGMRRVGGSRGHASSRSPLSPAPLHLCCNAVASCRHVPCRRVAQPPRTLRDGEPTPPARALSVPPALPPRASAQATPIRTCSATPRRGDWASACPHAGCDLAPARGLPAGCPDAVPPPL